MNPEDADHDWWRQYGCKTDPDYDAYGVRANAPISAEPFVPERKTLLTHPEDVVPDSLHRTFESGAIRDTEDGKIDYEGHLSVLVIERFGQYMNEKRHMADGSLRSSDNWQKGVPLDSYMKSGFRHFIEWWKYHRTTYITGGKEIEDTLCALIFNASGYLHEILKEKREDV